MFVYRLALPPSLSGVHAVFHVSMIWKYTPNPTHEWIGASLVLMQMEASRRDRYVSWIAEIRFWRQDCEASEGVVATSRSRGGNIGTRRHCACQLSFPI